MIGVFLILLPDLLVPYCFFFCLFLLYVWEIVIACSTLTDLHRPIGEHLSYRANREQTA